MFPKIDNVFQRSDFLREARIFSPNIQPLYSEVHPFDLSWDGFILLRWLTDSILAKKGGYHHWAKGHNGDCS